MRNGIKCTHLATSYSVEIPLNYKEMQLALDKTDIDASWNMMCEMEMERTGIEIIDQMELEFIVVEGTERPLH